MFPEGGGTNELIMSFEVQGDVIAIFIYLDGADWQGGEMECYAPQIACFSGLIWIAISVAIALPVRFLRRSLKGHDGEYDLAALQ